MGCGVGDPPNAKTIKKIKKKFHLRVALNSDLQLTKGGGGGGSLGPTPVCGVRCENTRRGHLDAVVHHLEEVPQLPFRGFNVRPHPEAGHTLHKPLQRCLGPLGRPCSIKRLCIIF